MRSAALLIEGADVPAATGATFDRLNPLSRALVTRAPAASIADAEHAANVAARAFADWSATAPNERRVILLKAADILLERTADFCALITGETGGTRGWGEFNCHYGASILREAAAITTQITGETIPADRPGAFAMAVRQPCGVVLSIAPWNAPVILGLRAIATALACGNSVILKASELCPGAHALIGDVLRDAGLPAGTLNVIHTAPDDAPKIVEALIAHAAVRRVNFTGSTRVGRTVAEVAARHLKRCLLELGGKAPLIVLDDADLEAAVDAAEFGAFINQGQVCISTDRVLVDEAVADEFLRLFTIRARSLQASDPADPACRLGPMISEQAASRFRGLVDDAVLKGADVLTRGRLDGLFVDPVVLDRVTPAMRIYYEEAFGPAATIIRFRGVEEAVSIANDTEYGLSAAVFGTDVGRALDVARRLETGICHINTSTLYDEPQMPFGGVKASGYGRFGGKAGIDEFTELRWISIHTGKQRYPG
jgi:acyl-CoA reductase-like NAD-dependent aldehyde dehydrogenase